MSPPWLKRPQRSPRTKMRVLYLSFVIAARLAQLVFVECIGIGIGLDSKAPQSKI